LAVTSAQRAPASVSVATRRRHEKSVEK